MSHPVFLVGRERWPRAGWAAPPTVLATPRAVGESLRDGPTDGLWITRSTRGNHWLSGAMLGLAPRRRRGTLLVLAQPEADGLAAATRFAHWFEHVILTPRSVLPLEQMAEILGLPNRDEYCIGGTVVGEEGQILLIRGDLSLLAAPFADFPPSGDGTRPDFDDFEVIDWGQALRFGAYEASMDAVLYLRDPVYRRKLQRHRAATDRSFGACLRRLRLQRRLRIEDFGPLARTVARIERGEVARPRVRTLQQVADRLGVRPDEIPQF